MQSEAASGSEFGGLVFLARGMTAGHVCIESNPPLQSAHALGHEHGASRTRPSTTYPIDGPAPAKLVPSLMHRDSRG